MVECPAVDFGRFKPSKVCTGMFPVRINLTQNRGNLFSANAFLRLLLQKWVGLRKSGSRDFYFFNLPETLEKAQDLENLLNIFSKIAQFLMDFIRNFIFIQVV